MSKAEELYAVLLKTGRGYKEEKDEGQLKPVTVCKGTLLVYLDSLSVKKIQEKYTVGLMNYKVVDRCENPQSGALLFATGSSISHITAMHRDFLLGVKQTYFRMELLKSLQWVQSLRLGSDVYVTITTIPTPVRGIIKYIGDLPGEEGRKFGIELMECRGQGTHNGEFKKQKYFKCDKDCAVFVAMDKITNCNAAEAAKVTKTPDTSVPKPPSKNNHSIKINDPVTFYDKYNILYRGVAKWIGTSKSTDTAVIGIEVEGHLSLADIPHCINIRENKPLFSSEKSKIFLPITFVRRDTSISQNRHSGDKDHIETAHGHGVPTSKVDGNSQNLVVGSAVQFLDKQYGVIKWIGTLPGGDKTYAGVEMEDYVDSFGGRDGFWGGTKYFDCEPYRGKFVLLNSLKPDQRIKKEKSSEAVTQSSGVNQSRSESVPTPDNIQLMDTNPHNLDVGSVIEYDQNCGVIKWIGKLAGDTELTAGLEMDDDIDEDYNDGEWLGVIYYECKPRRGVFVGLHELKPGRRLMPVFEEKSTNAAISTGVSSLQNPYNLTVGRVVQYGRPPKQGVIKWMGYFPDDQRIMYAGLIMDETIARGAHDGVWNDTRYYMCELNKGIFVPLLEVEPFIAGKRRGSADNVLLNTGIAEHHPLISGQPPSVDSISTVQLNQNPYKLEVGSTVEYGKPVEYGVIKWIGMFPGRENVLYAGLEMENIADNYSDGMYEGKQYFKSRAGRGIFVKMLALRPDRRFVDDTTPPQQVFKVGSKVQFGRAKEYGVIKWIGNVPGTVEEEQYVKVETEGRMVSGLIPLCQISAYVDNSSLKNEGESNEPKMSESASQQAKPIPAMLEVGSAVEFGYPVQYGVIKRIEEDPISNKEIAKIEMENYEQLKMPLDEIKPDSRLKTMCTKDPMKITKPDDAHVLPHPVQQALEVGSMVQFGNPVQYGVIKVIRKDPYSNAKLAEIETEDQGYKQTIPLVELQPDVRFISDVHHPQEDSSNSQHVSSQLETGSLVQFGNPVQYGVIKKIETGIAEVETEHNELKKIPLTELQPDNRFIIDVNKTEGNINPLEMEFYKHEETSFPVPPADKFDAVKHTEVKGIQGYQNSCYLDATLYGMFTFSDAFDILILEDVATNVEELNLQKRLKYEIVYPLRKKGIVVQNSIKQFREHLAEVQNIKGLTSEEKDPEEFLNLLFKHVLHLDPFITIRRPSGIDKEFFVQLFVEPDKDEPAANTQRLLTKMFQEQNINFVEYPTRLLLQMPRYGKRFKSFQRIIPSLELNVAPLCMTPGLCCICQRRMGYVCNECSHQKNQTHFYCGTCSLRWHQNYCDHTHELYNNDFDTGTLQLLSVLCIETSHYVCFTRITGSSGKDEWVFFDSMAERQDNGYNLPKVTHCTDKLQEFVYGEKDISRIPSKSLPELVRRFVEDAYLCIYIDYDGVMYQ